MSKMAELAYEVESRFTDYGMTAPQIAAELEIPLEMVEEFLYDIELEDEQNQFK